MAELLTWRQEWSTGIDWVDEDHREMARLLNRLADACGLESAAVSPGGQVTEVAGVLANLDAMVEHYRRHFQDEEAFLRRIAYPGLEEHCREHVLQMAEFQELRRGLERDPAQIPGPEVFTDFKRWFLDHVVAQDRRYADYYRAQAQGD